LESDSISISAELIAKNSLIKQLEGKLSARDWLLETTNDKVVALESEIVRLRDHIASLRRENEAQRQLLEEEHSAAVGVLKGEVDRCRVVLAESEKNRFSLSQAILTSPNNEDEAIEQLRIVSEASGAVMEVKLQQKLVRQQLRQDAILKEINEKFEIETSTLRDSLEASFTNVQQLDTALQKNQMFLQIANNKLSALEEEINETNNRAMTTMRSSELQIQELRKESESTEVAHIELVHELQKAAAAQCSTNNQLSQQLSEAKQENQRLIATVEELKDSVLSFQIKLNKDNDKRIKQTKEYEDALSQQRVIADDKQQELDHMREILRTSENELILVSNGLKHSQINFDKRTTECAEYKTRMLEMSWMASNDLMASEKLQAIRQQLGIENRKLERKLWAAAAKLKELASDKGFLVQELHLIKLNLRLMKELKLSRQSNHNSDSPVVAGGVEISYELLKDIYERVAAASPRSPSHQEQVGMDEGVGDTAATAGQLYRSSIPSSFSRRQKK
jgi:hypothetical protein